MTNPDVLHNLIQDLESSDPEDDLLSSEVPNSLLRKGDPEAGTHPEGNGSGDGQRFLRYAAAWAKASGVTAKVYDDHVDLSIFNPEGISRPDGHLAVHAFRQGFLSFSLTCCNRLRRNYISELVEIYDHPEIPSQGTAELKFLPSCDKGFVEVIIVLSWPFLPSSTNSDLQTWMDRGFLLDIGLRNKMKYNGLL